MKVLHVTPSYFPAKSYGGPVESTHQLCRALAEKGIAVQVLTTDADGPSRLAESGKTVEYSPNLHVTYAPRSMGNDFSFPLLGRLRGAIEASDVVHLTAVYSFTTIPSLFHAKGAGRPVVWSPRGSLKHWSGTTKSAAKSAWEKVCFASAPIRTFVHCTSEEEAQGTVLRLSTQLKTRVRVIPNGVKIPDGSRRADHPGLTLLFLGRLAEIKAVESLIDACRILASRGQTFRMVIAGDGDRDYVQSLRSRAVDLGNRVDFVGFADEAKKKELFATVSLLVLPSHSENFGMAAAEALAHSVPVVASKGTPWSGLETHGCGKWVENTPESLASAITELSQIDLTAAGERGREWMRQEFSWPHVADSMIKLYEEALRA